jgi:integrase
MLYMRKDEHGYKFVRPIPKNLQSEVGQANFIKRLGPDYRKARIACAEWTVATDRKLAEARALLANQDSLDTFLSQSSRTRLKSITVTPQLSGQVASLWLQGLDADAKARAEGLDDDEFESAEANVREMLPVINRALGSGQLGMFHNVINELLVMRGYQLNATDAEWQALTYEVLRHIQTGFKILAARQQGEQLSPPDLSALPAPLPAAWHSQKAALKKEPTRLADVAPLYEKHLASASDKTRSTKISIWNRLIEYTSNKLLSAVTSADIYNFIDSRLHAAEKPWSHGYATGKAKAALFEAFALSKTLALIDRNPVSELEILPKLSAKEEESRRKPRWSYTASQLNELFSSEWYNPDSTKWRGKMKDDLGARYWIPLLCMWHGFRVGEATQLQTHDVNVNLSLIKIQVDEDQDEVGPERSVKNSATKREIPIHPVLIQFGFLEFVRSILHHYPVGPLFPAALPELGGKSPKWGRAYEQPFLRFVRDTLQFGNGYGSHSFRHALEDRIREANVEQPWPEGLAHAYTGRATTRVQDKSVIREEGSEQYYGGGYSSSAILRYIQKITYPGVTLPLPFKTWLGGRAAVSKRLLTLAQRWKD